MFYGSNGSSLSLLESNHLSNWWLMRSEVMIMMVARTREMHISSTRRTWYSRFISLSHIYNITERK